MNWESSRRLPVQASQEIITNFGLNIDQLAYHIVEYRHTPLIPLDSGCEAAYWVKGRLLLYIGPCRVNI